MINDILVRVRKHPTLDVVCFSDGMLQIPASDRHPAHYTYGSKNKKGYRIIMRDKKNYLVHRLIAETFIPNPEGKPTVDHINRDVEDNRIENLRWATFKEQSNNTATVDNRVDYGVRKCDDLKGYRREYGKAYRAKNKELLSKKEKARRQENLEEIRAKDRERARNLTPEQKRHKAEYQHQWYLAHKKKQEVV